MNRENMKSLRQRMEEADQKAAKQAALRAQKAAKRRGHGVVTKKEGRADLKARALPNGEPTTAALDAWGAKEFRHLFNKIAGQHSRFKEGPIARDLATMAKFVEQLKTFAEDEYSITSLAPRAVYRIVRSAAEKLVRYRKQTDMKKPIGMWMLLTIGYDIVNDHASMLYGRGSFKFILTEDVDSRDIETACVDECVILKHTSHGEDLLLHRDKLDDNVLNPELRRRLHLDVGSSKGSKETEWEDPDGTGIHL